MKHPILSGNGYKLYLTIWLVIMLVHGSVLYFLYDFPATIAAADSLVFNLLFGAIVPGFWFIVSFSGLNRDRISLVGTHLGAATATILLWWSIASVLLRTLFSAEVIYLDFLLSSQVWRVIIGILFYSISVLIFYLIKYYQDMQKRMNRELELQNLLKDSELRMLKSQINPHFIFNSLNSISALTSSMPENAREMVIKLSDFLRFSLGKDHTELNSLRKEIENASLYLEIEKIRFGDRLQFRFDVGKECNELEIPNLLLQPLFENAIKYGVYDSLEPVMIALNAQRSDELLVIEIMNGYDNEAVPSKGEGIGLENVKKRLKLVYGNNDLLEVHKSSEEFKVVLKIPIYQSENE